MVIEEHICSSGVAVVPDMRGGRECYSDDQPYESLIITQTPEPGELVEAGQTVINVVTEDGKGNATICTHYLNVTADNPAPTLECPEPITTWFLVGGYVVPDFTKTVKVRGGCTVYDDLTITQSPAAGTLLTTVGTHTITITVEDTFGQTVVCGSTKITLEDVNTVNGGGGGPVTPPEPPITTPEYIYTQNLLAYWPLDDFGFLLDRTAYMFGTTPLDLTNAGGATQVTSQTIVSPVCHLPGPGPIFGQGSAYFNLSSTGYLSRADSVGLRLLGNSWTIRFGIKVVSVSACFHAISKNDLSVGAGDGYEILICSGAPGFIQAQLTGPMGSLTVPGGAVPLTFNQWILVALTFDITTGTMKLYLDGVLKNTQTMAGFTVGNSSPGPLYIGPPLFGSSVEAYMDEVGIWTEAWTPERVMADFNIITCM